MIDKDAIEGAESNLSVETIVSTPALNALEQEWNQLSTSARHPNVFTTFDWFREWLRFRVRDEPSGHYRPNILVVKQNEEIVGITPLVCRTIRHFGRSMRKLEFATYHADYHDLVLGDSQRNISSVVDHLARTPKEWDFIELSDLRDVEGSIERVTNALQKSRLHYRFFPETYRCPYMPITGPWSEMMKEHSRFMRRILRHCEAVEGLRMRIVEDPQSEPDLFQKLVALDSQKHVGGQPASPLLRPNQDVFQSILHTLGPRNWILVVLLEKDDILIAGYLLFRCGKKLWGYFTAYNQHYASLSPSTALIPTIVDYCYEHGFDEFDFLRGEEKYKRRWTKGVRSNYRLIIWNHRWKSRLGAFAYLMRRSLRHLAGADRASTGSAAFIDG